MTSKPVLVVEDDAVNLKLIVRYLTAKGLRVVTAVDAQEAERALNAESPGVVFVDFSLPSEDGLSWVKRMRKAGWADLPIVAVTAHAMPEDKARALAAGCNEFLTKPIDFKVLFKLALKYLESPAATVPTDK